MNGGATALFGAAVAGWLAVELRVRGGVAVLMMAAGAILGALA